MEKKIYTELEKKHFLESKLAKLELALAGIKLAQDLLEEQLRYTKKRLKDAQ